MARRQRPCLSRGYDRGVRSPFECRPGVCAPSLIGLDGREAKDLAVREGYYRSQVVTPDVEALTLDLDSLRIRLIVDDLGVVVRASAG
jgi:hypothetical protein